MMDEYDGPVGIGHFLRISTMGTVDTPALADAVRDAFALAHDRGRRP